MLTPAGNLVQPVGFDPSGNIVPLQVTADGYLRVSAQNLTEDVQDIVGAMVSGNTESGIAVTYDDPNGKLNFNVDPKGNVYLTNANEFYRGGSLTFAPFTATINGAPSGSTLVYNAPSAGNENDLIQQDGSGVATANNLTAIVLRNTTRGTEALISSVVTATKTITLTGAVPAGWANGDTITTNAGQGSNFRAAEIKDTSVIPSTAIQLLLFVKVLDTAAAIQAWFQGYETFSASKTWVLANTPGANLSLTGFVTVPLISRRFMYQPRSPAGNTALIVVRIVGYKSS